MRVSVANGDHLRVESVSVNGSVVPCCIEADDTEGWAICYVTDDRGIPAISGDILKTIRHTGVVHIEWVKPK